MRVSILASGSLGNATLIESGDTKILIDAGLNCKKLTERMAQVGVRPEQLTAICCSHGHADHVAGLKVLTKKLPIPIYATSGTQDEVNIENRDWKTIEGGKSYDVGRLQIEPFSIPHDAAEPTGFLVRDAEMTYAQATDLGHPSILVIERLKEANILLLESNYDQKMLLDISIPRPWAIRQRTASRMGHLANSQAAEAIKQIVNENTEHILLGHLSRSYNTMELARSAAQAALDEIGSKIPLTVIDPNSTTVTTL
jgi:phosphoribosyl 1,2-cyclic phosphodiesterase